MCPTQDGNEPEKPRPQRWEQKNPEAAATYRRRYREAHSEKLDAARQVWRERNPERTQELNRQSARRQAHRRQQRLKRNAHSREWYGENREVAVERSRRFRTEHPEKVREYQRRYKERHPERARLNSRSSVQRYRDRNADEIRAKQRTAAAAHRETNPDAFKQWYAKNLEAQRARGRDASRRRSRLKKLGLPPRRIHRVYADARRAHAAAADEYFARRRSVTERGEIAAEARDHLALHIPEEVARRRRVVLKAQSTPLTTRMGENVVGDNDHGLPAEVFQWRRARDIHALKESHEHLVNKIRADRPSIFEHHQTRRQARLREEIRMDSIARTARGLPEYDPEQETDARLNDEVDAIVNRKLAAVRERTIARGQDIMRKHASNQDPAAPFSPPGTAAGPGASMSL